MVEFTLICPRRFFISDTGSPEAHILIAHECLNCVPGSDLVDSGLSTKIEGLTVPEITKKIGALFMGEKSSVPYSIEDMADDAIGLLDALDIDKAHICGMSMGGYIAQTLCLNHSSRALSLTSIYSQPGNRKEFVPTQEVLEAMLTPMPEERGAYIEQQTAFLKLIYGTGLPFDESFHRNLVGKSYDRSLCTEGTARHYLAIMTQKNRASDLGQLKIPTLVIHGDEDPLVPFVGGKATADAIPNSELKMIKGMGHVMPNLEAYWSDILDAMVSHMG